MEFFRRKITLVESIGILAGLLGVWWALTTPTMLASIDHVRGKPQSVLLGDICGWLIALSPFVGIASGWAIIRRHRGWVRQALALAVGIIVWTGIFCLGVWLRWPTLNLI